MWVSERETVFTVRRWQNGELSELILWFSNTGTSNTVRPYLFSLILHTVWPWAWAVGARCCCGGWLWRYVPIVALNSPASLSLSDCTLHCYCPQCVCVYCVGSVLFLVLLGLLASLVSREGVIIQLPVVCCYTVQLIQSLREMDRNIRRVNVKCLFIFVRCCENV